jgi:hypothetical protein
MSGLTPAPTMRVHGPSRVAAHGVALKARHGLRYNRNQSGQAPVATIGAGIILDLARRQLRPFGHGGRSLIRHRYPQAPAFFDAYVVTHVAGAMDVSLSCRCSRTVDAHVEA